MQVLACPFSQSSQGKLVRGFLLGNAIPAHFLVRPNFKAKPSLKQAEFGPAQPSE